MELDEKTIRQRIQNNVINIWRTQEFWCLLKEFEGELENAAKGVNETEEYKMIILRIVSRSLISMREILILCEAGYSDGAFSIARTIYEQCIHALFFIAHEKDEIFGDYIKDYLLNANYQIYKYNMERANIFDDVDKEELQNEWDEMKRKSVHHFPEMNKPNDYWWADKTSFWGLVDDVKKAYEDMEDKMALGKMHLFYTATNRTIHANAAGNAQRIGREYISNVIDTEPNWTGQGYPLYFSTMCLTIIILYSCDRIGIERGKYFDKMNELLCYYNKCLGEMIGGNQNQDENKNKPE